MKRQHRRLPLTALLLAAGLAVSACPAYAHGEHENDTHHEEGLPEFRPSEQGFPAQERYEYPYMGMTAEISDALRAKMESLDVILRGRESYNDDGSLQYAALQWYTLTQEQKEETVTSYDPDTWYDSLSTIGSIGVYQAELAGSLDTYTGCTSHTELGKSADGAYVYYMSLPADADASLVDELKKTQVSITDMLKLNPEIGDTAFSEPTVDAQNTGDFTTTDINGETVTRDVFADYDLTLVNIFATWCSPCIQEMPELEKLYQTLAEKGVGVVGIVHDTMAADGSTDAAAVETAKLLQEKLGISFPLLIPDETLMNGRLQGIDSVPESFFVDRNGNIVGESYIGARSYDAWAEIVESELAALTENTDAANEENADAAKEESADTAKENADDEAEDTKTADAAKGKADNEATDTKTANAAKEKADDGAADEETTQDTEAGV